jgi:GTP-binding protein
MGAVIEKLGQRKGELLEMHQVGSRMRLEYLIPTRCLFGYRTKFMTDTHGEGILNTIFDSYAPYKGEIPMRFTGSLVASETNETTTYGIYNCQDRGRMFVVPGQPVYEGMVVGECPKMEDITLNPCKRKQLTAIRSSGADEKLLLTPPVLFSLEEAIEFIGDDELIEATPKSIRIRKRILNTETRLKAQSRIKRGLDK